MLLDFVQIRGEGGGPCPNFLSTFHNLFILGQFADGEGARIIWHIGVKKKWYKLSKLEGDRGGRVEVIWTTSKRTATFFRETVPQLTSSIPSNDCEFVTTHLLRSIETFNHLRSCKKGPFFRECGKGSPVLKSGQFKWAWGLLGWIGALFLFG